MRILLNEAVNEMMIRVINELVVMRKEVELADTIGHKVQIVDEHKAVIFKLFNKLDFLEMQAIMKFEEGDQEELIGKIRRFKYHIAIQIEDVYRIAEELA